MGQATRKTLGHNEVGGDKKGRRVNGIGRASGLRRRFASETSPTYITTFKEIRD